MKFEEFLKKTKDEGETLVAMEIDGSFTCHTCREDVETAEWFQGQKFLRWSCPQGHTSYIEDFSL